MATYQNKWCPHCKHPYIINESTNNKIYGSPFIVCKKCSNVFIDKDIREMALEGDAPVNTRKFSFIDIMMLIFGVLFIYCAFDSASDMFYLFIGGGIFFFFGGLYLLITDIKSFDKRRQDIYQEFLESSQRLSNPEYLQALKSIGVYLPPKYSDYLSKSKESQKDDFSCNIAREEIQKVKVKPVKKI